MSVTHIAGGYFLFPHNKRIRTVDSNNCFFFFPSSVLYLRHATGPLPYTLVLENFTLLGTYAPCWVVITDCLPQVIFLKLCMHYTLGLHLPEEPNSYVCPVQEHYFEIVDIQLSGSFDSFVVNPQTYFEGSSFT